MVARPFCILFIFCCLSLVACAKQTRSPQYVHTLRQVQICPAPTPPPAIALEHGPEGLRDAYNIEAAVAAIGWWLDYISDLEACVRCYEAQAVNATGAGE